MKYYNLRNKLIGRISAIFNQGDLPKMQFMKDVTNS